MSDSERPFERAMVVVAHPDDAEFGAGGTVASWVAQGLEVTFVLVTDGSKGSPDRSLTSEALADLRVTEQRAAADVLGVRNVVHLGIPDGEVLPDLAVRHAITREIRRHKPDILVTHDPSTFYLDTYINHPDHRAVGQAALEAVFPTARDFLNAPHLLAEGFEPHNVREVWLTLSRDPDHVIDIGPYLERKIDALREHASQFQDFDQVAKWVRKRAEGVAEKHLGIELAESFKRITLS